MKVAVVGAGLAGLAAALRLQERGHDVTLIEKRPFAGGRAYSFLDKESGEEIDNGQHVILSCCTEYIDFVKRIGAGDILHLQPRLAVPFVRATDRRVFWIRSSWLPLPYHLMFSVLRYKPLTFAERRRTNDAVSAMRAMNNGQLRGADDRTFAAWLSEHGQSGNAIRNFWDVAVLAMLNDHADRVSASQAIFVFRGGFLDTRDGARMGYAKAGLGEIARRAVATVERSGGTAAFGKRVARIESGKRVVLADGQALDVDTVISAAPAKALLEMLPEERRADPFFGRAARLETSPIVNLHVWFDREVWDLEFACFLECRLQWVFNRTKILGRPAGTPTRLAVSLSGARDVMAMEDAEVRRTFEGELERIFGAKPSRMAIVREPHATFLAAPGSRSMRLPAKTPVPGLYLAGEWTDVEWPSTMEGAIRSGRRAADLIMSL